MTAFWFLVSVMAGDYALAAQTETISTDTVSVESIKEKYWARGNEAELGVVQDRLYTKDRKTEFGIMGGIVASDPFLSIQNIGFTAGYHFNEHWGAHFVAWKTRVQPSIALLTFQDTRGATTNTNEPRYFLGGEATGSLIYGKLSLAGRAIIYYDLHMLGGLGWTSTESGTNMTPSIGLGQKIYLSKLLSLRVDYRLMPYREDILEKVIPTKLGQTVGERTNWSNVVTIGTTFLFGEGKP